MAHEIIERGLGVTRRYRLSNDAILKELGVDSIITRIQKQQL